MGFSVGGSHGDKEETTGFGGVERWAGTGGPGRGPTWLAHLLVPIWRLMVEWSMGGRIWFLGSYRCLLVPYAVMPD